MAALSRALCGLGIVLLLSACSGLQLAYDNADFLLNRALSSYVDLDRGQARTLQVQVNDLHRWHRAYELPNYAALLDDAADRVARGLRPEDVAWASDQMRIRFSAVGERFAVELAPVLVSLSDAQVDALEAKLASDTNKWERKWVADNDGGLTQRRAAWMAHRFEDWVGELTPQQRERIERLAAATRDIPAARALMRQRMQAQVVHLVRWQRDYDALSRDLTALLAQPETHMDARYRRVSADFERKFSRMLIDLDRSLTPRQRQYLVDKLRHFARECRALAAVRVTAR